MKNQDRITDEKSLNAAGGDNAQTAIQPNKAMLDTMKRVAEIQKGMNPKRGRDSLEHLREAREGAMYGYDSDE